MMNKKEFNQYAVNWTPEEKYLISGKKRSARRKEVDCENVKLATGSFAILAGIASILGSTLSYIKIKELEKQLDAQPSPLEEGAAIIQSVAPNTDAAKTIVKLAQEERNKVTLDIANNKQGMFIMWSITGFLALTSVFTAAGQRYYGSKSQNNSIAWRMYKKHVKTHDRES